MEMVVLLVVAAQAHCTSTVLSYGASYRGRRYVTFPVLSLQVERSPGEALDFSK